MSAKKQKMGPLGWLRFWWCCKFHQSGILLKYVVVTPSTSERKEVELFRCASCRCCTRKADGFALRTFSNLLPPGER